MIDERRTQRGAEHGIASDDEWDEHEVPDEYQRLTSVWLDLRNRIEAEWLESSGDVEMARLLRTAVGEYMRRQIRGWSAMFGMSLGERVAGEGNVSGGEGP
jgi:hypothetical protein